ncbi:flagellar type III secretion system pore protein FliP [Aeromonas diversa]|uniref:Flagellar biosynthetic protein FliP n=1 Tax=Aeromonas diversa CDC 2478-85 TaxID=1268237 RepID=N9TZ80_9GAMM|nr:flagellar type III secretion system pore protein FliP [Aeromonas diversa]ENY71429.1 flagellar biosynthesis protein FliP [Aeromonas diversa CDC 2478-85]
MRIWCLLLLVLGMPAWGADLTLFSVTPGAAGGEEYNIKLQILLLMTLLGLLPTLLLMMTSFTRIIIVLAILRQALGLQQSPPNRVLIGISLILTLVIMRPVWTDIHQNAFQPFEREEITLPQALERAEVPLRNFMLAQTREADLEQMLRIAGEATRMEKKEVPFGILVPAYVLSELNTAFQIGFMLFIPFLVIDLVVASVLMAMGMMMLSPLIISLPFKLMVFVLVDGWAMTVGTLAASFSGG